MISRFFWTATVVASLALLPTVARADAQGDLTAGRTALEAGDFDKALTLLSSAAQALPQSVDAHMALAECYLKRGENDKALEKYQAVLKLSPNHAAAKRIIESLTGGRQTYEQKLALAQAFVKMGAYDQALRVAQQAIIEGADAAQREKARLVAAQALLWSHSPVALEEGMRLIQGGQFADDGRAIAALVLLMGAEPNIERAAALLKELPAQPAADAGWKPLAALAQTIIDADDETKATTVSQKAGEALAVIPPGALRSAVVERFLQRVEVAAHNKRRKGDFNGALAIAWPMLGSADDLNANPAKFNGGWLSPKTAKGANWIRAAKLLAAIGNAQAVQSGHDAPLAGFRLAIEAVKQIREPELKVPALLEIAGQLAPLVRANPIRKLGEPLNQAYRLLAGILNELRPLLLNEEQRQAWVGLAANLITRYEALNDLEYGLAIFAPLPYTTKDAPNDLLGPAQQTWLVLLAGKESTLGAKAFNEAAATLTADANKELNKHDENSLLLYGGVLQLYPDDKGAMATAQSIIDRYAGSEKWAAVAAANEALLAGATDSSLPWSLLRLKIRQSQVVEDKLLAGNRLLPKELPVLVKEAVATVLKEYADRPTKEMKQRVIVTLDGLIYRYASLERRDLADAILTQVSEGKPAKFEDWMLWVKSNLQSRDATRAFAAALAQSPEPKKLTLIAPHQTELDLLSQIIAKHSDSDYFAKALARVSQIANLYQERGAYDTATGVLAAFVKANPTLKVTERLEYDILNIQLQKAQQAFAERKDKVQPPEKLSAEYLALIDGVAAYLKNHPTGVNANSSLQTLLQIARTYGQVKAWPVAREVLDRFAKVAPDFRSPSQLKLWQAATYLGELDVAYGLSLLNPPAPPTPIAAPKGASKGEVTGVLAVTESEDSFLRDARDRFYAEAGEGKKFDEAKKMPPAETPLATATPTTPGNGLGGLGIGGAGGGAFGPGTVPAPAKPADPAALASQLAIAQAQRGRIAQIAMMKDGPAGDKNQPQQNGQGAGDDYSIVLPAGPVLTEAEMKRQDEASDKAYAILIELVKNSPLAEAVYGDQARNQIVWLFGFFEGQLRADRTVALIKKFMTDRPSDSAKVQLAYRVLNDQLVWAGQRQPKDRIDKKWLDGRHTLFEAARKEIAQFIKDFTDRHDWISQARLLSVDSYEREAVLASVVSPVRAAGLLSNGVDALLTLYRSLPNHPAVGNFAERMWNSAERLRGLQQEDLAIQVLSQIPMNFPLSPRAQQAVMRIAELYATNLVNPLRAVETYQEYLSVVGDNEAIRAQIFSIAQQLASRQRYLEALHVYGVFVDSFPTDQRAPEALRAIGQTHQSNEAWEDAIKAYQRVLDQFPGVPITPQVQLALAECEINLSKWTSARKRYEEFITKYPQDGQVALARQRIDILKQLDRYQALLGDDQVQRNKDDAQYQIGVIVNDRLANKVKAIEEFRKVVKNYPKSSPAASAQLEIGKSLLALSKLDEAREELLKLPKNHPGSPLADDALFLLAQSFEQAAQRLAGVTLEKARSEAFEQGQRGAYQQFAATGRAQEEQLSKRRDLLKMSGKTAELALDEAGTAWRFNGGNLAIVSNSTVCAEQMAETASALQVANRQDKINDAYRQAVGLYGRVASEYPLGDVTDKSLLRMAQILETELKNHKAAMETYQKIVKHFPGTPVAENAAWRVAEFYEQEGKYKEAVDAYREFIRNYPASPKVADAQFAVAEGLEQLDRWVEAMEAYETFRQKFTAHPKSQVALDQINWIRAYRK